MGSSSPPTISTTQRCADAAIDQIDQLLVSILDEYALDGEARVRAAIDVLSWMFTNIIYSRNVNYTTAASQAETMDNLCAALKSEAVTALLSAPAGRVQ